MKSSRLHRILSFSKIARTAFSMVSLLIFFIFSRTKTISINAASATARFFSELITEVIMAVCSGTSPKSQRKRQFVSRLGISFPNMGFPPIAGCRQNIRSAVLSHFLFKELPHFVKSVRRRDVDFYACLNAAWNRTRQLNEYPVISRYCYCLFNGHVVNIA